MQNLRSKLIHLASHNPSLRPHLLPLLEGLKTASIPIVEEPEGWGGPLENCCLCRTPTKTWTDYPKWDKGEQVALCEACARVATPDVIPLKKDWIARERVLAKRGP
jgi:hypothetical protein